MEMAKYILQILRYNLPVVFSWGFHNPVAIENGLQFNVDGFLHRGKCQVIYDEGYDTFTVRTLNRDGSIKKEVSDVYIDGLVEVIDGMVERCENYKKRVEREYGLFNR